MGGLKGWRPLNSTPPLSAEKAKKTLHVEASPSNRRFQKIFEEGPPTIAKKEVFHEMERAAMRLTALVGYRGGS